MLVERHAQAHGSWPRRLALTAWGTSNMRTGGDDIAPGLALMGVRPRWDAAPRRVTGFEVLPLDALDRPRVDVTLPVSGIRSAKRRVGKEWFLPCEPQWTPS